MMGHRQVEQAALFYEFSLERHIPADHLLRSIDRFVELGELRRELAPFYSSMGRPSIDPELMIRMLIVGYCFGIRSERRLCEEVHLNLAYRWFCRLGLDGEVPDHSTFSKNRHGRFRESDLLRRVFETVLRRCIDEGLVGGEAFAVDASLIKADANRQKGIEGEKGSAAGSRRPRSRRVSGRARRCSLRRRDRGHAQVHLTGRSGGALDRRPWRASLLCLLDQLSDRHRQRDHRRCRGDHRDPAGRGARRQAHDRTRRWNASISIPARLLGDSAYGSAEMLGWLVYEHGIEPHVTVFDKSARKDGTFSREDFKYDHRARRLLLSRRQDADHDGHAA